MDDHWLLAAQGHGHDGALRSGRSAPALPPNGMYGQPQQPHQNHSPHFGSAQQNATQEILDHLLRSNNPASPHARGLDSFPSSEPQSPTQMLLSLLGLVPQNSNGPSPRRSFPDNYSNPWNNGGGGSNNQQVSSNQQLLDLFEHQPAFQSLLHGAGSGGSGYTPRAGDINMNEINNRARPPGLVLRAWLAVSGVALHITQQRALRTWQLQRKACFRTCSRPGICAVVIASQRVIPQPAAPSHNHHADHGHQHHASMHAGLVSRVSPGRGGASGAGVTKKGSGSRSKKSDGGRRDGWSEEERQQLQDLVDEIQPEDRAGWEVRRRPRPLGMFSRAALVSMLAFHFVILHSTAICRGFAPPDSPVDHRRDQSTGDVRAASCARGTASDPEQSCRRSQRRCQSRATQARCSSTTTRCSRTSSTATASEARAAVRGHRTSTAGGSTPARASRCTSWRRTRSCGCRRTRAT
jgi:hypothetical protein